MSERGHSMSLGDAVALVEAARVGRLATISRGPRPHVVPFTFALLRTGAGLRVYWGVDRKPKRSPRLQRIRNVESNPEVEFVVDRYDEDWGRLWWIRVSGSARVVRDADERTAAVEALRAKYPQYAAEPPEGPIMAIDVERVTGWSSAEA